MRSFRLNQHMLAWLCWRWFSSQKTIILLLYYIIIIIRSCWARAASSWRPRSWRSAWPACRCSWRRGPTRSSTTRRSWITCWRRRSAPSGWARWACSCRRAPWAAWRRCSSSWRRARFRTRALVSGLCTGRTWSWLRLCWRRTRSTRLFSPLMSRYLGFGFVFVSCFECSSKTWSVRIFVSPFPNPLPKPFHNPFPKSFPYKN